MTVTVKALVESKYIANSNTTEYTATSVKTTIDKMTVTNVAGGSVYTFNAYIVANGDTAGSDNQLVVNRAVQPGETYLCPELVGHSLDLGDFIVLSASATNALVVRISGREIT